MVDEFFEVFEEDDYVVKEYDDLSSLDKSVLNKFPMISYESTSDSGISRVSMCESKFLNDDLYKKNWFGIYDNYTGDCISLINVVETNGKLEIKAFEINFDYRSMGYGRRFYELIEYASLKSGLYSIILNAFDTNAYFFWKHMNFEDIDLHLEKKIWF